MPGMKRAHGRHQADGQAPRSGLGHGLTNSFNGVCDDHEEIPKIEG
jgi:hypothetical protein